MKFFSITMLIAGLTLSFGACTKKPETSSVSGDDPASASAAIEKASEPAISTEHEPETVARMSQLILAIVDEIPAFKKVGVACETPGLQAGTLSQPLRMVWDETVARLKRRAKTSAVSWAKTCAAACACDLYLEALDGLPDSVPGVKEIRSKGVEPVTEAERIRCAQAIADPCHSPLFIQLRENARANAPTEGL